MLSVYFTASTPADSNFISTYKKIVQLLRNNRIISGKQITSISSLKHDKQLTPVEIFTRQKKLIERADLVVAEVTKPSLGVGGEIVYALTHNIPVLALIAEANDDTLSPMLLGNPSENLYIEHYTDKNLRYIVANFLKHVTDIQKRKGHLIVLDGGNGSGKATQSKLLQTYFKKHELPFVYYDFPQYYSSFHGQTVAKFLRGEFGTIDQVSPYLASLAYALDRASVKQEMEDALKQGKMVLANRYAPSSMAHQGSKFVDKKEREKYLAWHYELEYKVHRIPKEKIVMYLHVPWQISQELTSKKHARKYLKGKAKDIEEASVENVKRSEEMYLALAKKYPHWHVVECAPNGKLLSKQAIHEQIIHALKDRHILPR